MLQFHAEVVGVNLRAQLDLLDLGGVLMLPGILFPFGLLATKWVRPGSKPAHLRPEPPHSVEP
jgi:hypothetical protein